MGLCGLPAGYAVFRPTISVALRHVAGRLPLLRRAGPSDRTIFDRLDGARTRRASERSDRCSCRRPPFLPGWWRADAVRLVRLLLLGAGRVLRHSTAQVR